MRRYEKYKDSDLPWVGKVPKHWDLIPNRAVLKLKKESVGTKSDDYLLLSLTKQGVIARDMENPEGKFPSSFDTYQVIEKGDLIFCLFDIDETPRAVGLSELDGMITGAYTRFACDSAIVRYIYYFYLAMDNHKRLKPLYTGMRKTIQKSKFLGTKMPLPSLEEQKAIVSYLDKKLERIDTFIKNKQRLIALLEEQKTSTINRLITKGLNLDVDMKESRLEGIGMIPKHWEVKPGRYIFSEVNKRSENGEETILSVTQTHGVVPTSKLLELGISSTQSESAIGNKKCEIGDLILNKLKAHLGVFFRTDVPGLVSPDYTVFRPRIPLETKYYEYLFHHAGYIHQFRLESRGIVMGFMRLYTDGFNRIPILYPPEEEQKAIIKAIKIETKTIQKAISNAQKEIDLINEYRTTLISEVVTGKIDVRTAS